MMNGFGWKQTGAEELQLLETVKVDIDLSGLDEIIIPPTFNGTICAPNVKI